MSTDAERPVVENYNPAAYETDTNEVRDSRKVPFDDRVELDEDELEKRSVKTADLSPEEK